MATIERTPQRLVVRAGDTTLTLDKEAGTARLGRRLLMWERKPVERPLADIVKIAVVAAVDRSCGYATCYTLLVARSGEDWELPPAGTADAERTAQQMRTFLGLD
jgi:hypothetical protein